MPTSSCRGHLASSRQQPGKYSRGTRADGKTLPVVEYRSTICCVLSGCTACGPSTTRKDFGREEHAIYLTLSPTPTPGQPVWKFPGKIRQQKKTTEKSRPHLEVHTGKYAFAAISAKHHKTY